MAPTHKLVIDHDEYKDLCRSIENNIIIEANHYVSPAQLIAVLHSSTAEEGYWTAGYLGGDQFLIQGPSKWRSKVTKQGVASIGEYHFKVCTDKSELKLPSHKHIWVILTNLRYEIRSINTIRNIVRVFGKFLNVDENTMRNIDLRWARVQVEVPIDYQLPPKIPFKLSIGAYKEVEIEIGLQEESDVSDPTIQLLVVYPQTYMTCYPPVHFTPSFSSCEFHDGCCNDNDLGPFCPPYYCPPILRQKQDRKPRTLKRKIATSWKNLFSAKDRNEYQPKEGHQSTKATTAKKMKK